MNALIIVVIIVVIIIVILVVMWAQICIHVISHVSSHVNIGGDNNQPFSIDKRIERLRAKGMAFKQADGNRVRNVIDISAT